MDATANKATPQQKTSRLPKRSPIEPPTKSSAARKSEYDSTTHWTAKTLARKLCCSPGRATFTAVASMTALLNHSIGADRIHGSASRAHGTAAGLDKTTPSSHGCLKIFAMF